MAIGSSDQAHLAHAIRDGRAVLTQNYGDFQDLHDLVVSAASGHHCASGREKGVRPRKPRGSDPFFRDNNPRNTMSLGDIARAVRNLEKAGVPIADSYHELNHWQ